ncbi:MAG: hypothetical protein FJ245_04065 [Nitrospira sp.]|nr:hypothetical protein [Nitrospirota bacterium]MBM4132924.1 hypothetical protein [Nitrospira sp.]
MSPKLQEELLQQMARLPEEQQKRVLAFVKGLVPVGGGVAGQDLLKFSGAIEPADLQAMAKAIEEGCERIDQSEW